MGLDVSRQRLEHGQRVRIISADQHMAGCMAGMIHECGTVMRFIAVMVKMVGLGIGNDGDGGVVFGEAAVGLIGLSHQPVTLATVQGGTVRPLDGTADGIAGISSGMHQNVRKHGTGSGFAVRTGHGHGSLAVHQ